MRTREKLLKLCPDRAYRPEEEAYVDKFFDPYVGKYSVSNGHEVSEAISMGFQCFCSDWDLATLRTLDPEHFYLIMGMCLQSENTRSKEEDQIVQLYMYWLKSVEQRSTSEDFKRKITSENGISSFKVMREVNQEEKYTVFKLLQDDDLALELGVENAVYNIAYLEVLFAQHPNLQSEDFDIVNSILPDNLSSTENYKVCIPSWFTFQTILPMV